MFEIEVNNMMIGAREGDTILTALERAGIKVPTLCHVPGLAPTGACRICVVEVEGQRNLVPSCSFPVQPGMRINTNSPRVVQARKTIIELLLANHPDDCLFCIRNGECDLQQLAAVYGVRERRFATPKLERHSDVSSPSIVRDQAKCILCGKCVRVCEEIMGVAAIDFVGRGSGTVVCPAFREGVNVSSCVNCGQCVMVCPTGALHEKSSLKEVTAALDDPERVVVFQHAPAVSVTLAEEFGLKPGADVAPQLTAALRRLGADYVFDTGFAADLTIMEEASELVQRIRNGGRLPMFTSCSPGWIKYVEQFFPEFIGNLSTCKSPQQMQGAVIKSYFADRKGLDPRRIYSVAVMPCTAKKYEAARPEMGHDGVPDIDAVLTTREAARLIRIRGLDFGSLAPEHADLPLGERSTAGKLFGSSGGVMEAAVRTAHWLITGQDMASLRVQPMRGMEGVKEARVKVQDLELGVAVVSGLANARRLLEQVAAGRDDLHFIEVMTCPGGCVNGGGQPLGADADAARTRQQALYQIDQVEAVRQSHRNTAVQELYAEFLGEPLGERSHRLLHTGYSRQEVVV